MSAVAALRATGDAWARRAWRFWPATAAAASALVLAIAHAFEAAGYEPCMLCLRQRELYWAAIAIAVVGGYQWVREPDARVSRAVDALIGAAFFTGAVIAFYHAGVEWKFWPGPESCAVGDVGGLTGDDIANALGSGGVVALCDEAAWRDPVLRLSMAGWNGLISLGLGVASFFAASRGVTGIVASVDG